VGLVSNHRSGGCDSDSKAKNNQPTVSI